MTAFTLILKSGLYLLIFIASNLHWRNAFSCASLLLEPCTRSHGTGNQPDKVNGRTLVQPVYTHAIIDIPLQELSYTGTWATVIPEEDSNG